MNKNIYNTPPSQEKGFEWDIVTNQYESASFHSLPDLLRKKWFNYPKLSGFSVFSCGYYQRAEGHKWERNNLNEGVVVYCVEGKGNLAIDGEIYSVTAGDVFYCPPNTKHGYNADHSDPWSIYWMHVSGEQLEGLADFHHLFVKKPVQHIGLMPELIIFFRSLVQKFDIALNPQRWLLSSLCAQHILAYISSAPKLEQSTIPHVMILNALINHMHEVVNTRVPLDELIQETGLSKTHLCRVFKDFTGFSPMAYLNKLKIEKACVMLSASSIMISEVAYQLGFDDPYYFSRLFKKATGHPPRKFRNLYLTDSRTNYAPFA